MYRRRQLEGDRACTANFTLADTAIDVIYTFRANHFVSVVLSYAPKDFDRIAAVFVERYGAPTSEERPESRLWAVPQQPIRF